MTRGRLARASAQSDSFQFAIVISGIHRTESTDELLTFEHGCEQAECHQFSDYNGAALSSPQDRDLHLAVAEPLNPSVHLQGASGFFGDVMAAPAT